MTDRMWRKSSRSGAGANACIEVRNTLDGVRDSKNPGGPTLRADLAAFMAAVKDGRFAR